MVTVSLRPPCASLCNAGHRIRLTSRSTLVIRSVEAAALSRGESATVHNDGYGLQKSTNSALLCMDGLRERIREHLDKLELSASSYDTAWVAMVPSPESPQTPCFPQCLEWILDNQHPDGSWGFSHFNPSLIKDSLSSTLACILALSHWKLGQEHVSRGLKFIGDNFSSSMNDQLPSPIGFNIIFPGMLEYAINMGIHLPVKQRDIAGMLHKRDAELQSECGNYSEGAKAYMAYIAEGLGERQDWKDLMKYQKKNGSFFNSPSTTAAALAHIYDVKSFQYLHSLLQKFGSSVPTTYPLDIYSQLDMVDKLQMLGIDRHYSSEIQSILDKIYRSWLMKEEEISSDMATCSMAFRLLRGQGYDIFPDALSMLEVNYLNNSIQGHLKDLKTMLELYKASEMKIHEDEYILDKLRSWSKDSLKCALSIKPKHQFQVALREEVDYAIRFPSYSNLDRLEHKRYIENFNTEKLCILKSSFRYCAVDNKDLWQLAVEDYNSCQIMYQEELENLENWVKENKLDQLGFARQKQTYCYLSAAATLYSPELSDARMCWAKNGVLTTVVDDFFDVGGSREELECLISLVERWDDDHQKDYCSDQVKIIFSALHSTISDLGAKASELQKRSITEHLVEIWLSLIKSMMKEAEWQRNKEVPTMSDYVTNGCISMALGPIILPALYFVGQQLTEDVIRHPQYQTLFRLVSMCGRLLNDIQSFQREQKEAKLNSVPLQILHSGGSMSEEDAKTKIQSMIDSSRTELLKLVLLGNGSVVPRPCKDLFWKMSRILHMFYMKNDGFTSPREMAGAVHAVIHEPLRIPASAAKTILQG